MTDLFDKFAVILKHETNQVNFLGNAKSELKRVWPMIMVAKRFDIDYILFLTADKSGNVDKEMLELANY